MVAFKMGMAQSQFDALSAEDRAYAIAVYRAENAMDAYESQLAQAEMASKAK